MLKKLLMASCAMLITCSPAFATDKKPMGMGPVDANKDNIVSTSEAEGAAEKQFANLDADKDGKISESEFAAGGKAIMAKMPAKFLEKNKGRFEESQKKRFAMLDSNKDKNVTKDEMKSDMQKRHKAMDANGDGNVTKEELMKFHEIKKGTAKK